MVSLRLTSFFFVTLFFLATHAPLCAETMKLSKSDRHWLEREVAALITEEETQIFLDLDTEGDRKRFKELFWLRRDPDLMTSKNELREGYKRRVKYANRYFGQREGIKGSATDMGKVFVLLGLPATPEEEGRATEGSEAFASGQLVSATDTSAGALPEFSGADLASSMQAAVGTEQTRTWTYEPNRERGLPEGLTIEFVLEQGLGMTFREPEDVVGALNYAKKSFVFHSDIDYARDSEGRLKGLPVRFDPRSPAKKALRELTEKEIVKSDIAFSAETAFFRATDGTYVPVSFEIAPERLSWKDSVAAVTLFGVIETMDGRSLYRFEEPAKLSRNDDGPSVFDLPVQLAPGSYTFNLGILDDRSGKVGTQRVPVFVRDFKEGALDMSSVLLYTESREVDEPPATPGHSFQFGRVHFTPAPSKRFTLADTMGILFFVYGFELDARGQPSLTSDYVLFKDDEKLSDVPAQPLQAGSKQAIARLELPLEKFSPGNYRVQIEVTDQITNEVITDRVEFLLEPEFYPVAVYSDLVESYREGAFVESAEALARVRQESLERAVRDYQKRALGENELKMAALLHTEVAFHDRRAVLFHLKSARSYLNQIEDDSARTALLRRWYLAVSNLLRGSMQSWAALRLVQDASQMFPQDPEILLAVGSVYDAAGWMGIAGMLERSEKFYREILVTQPENAEVHLRLGRVMQLRGRSGEALRELKLSLEYAPDAEIRFVAHMLIGHVSSQLGRMPEAVEAFRKSLEIDPHCQAAAVALSHALHRSGDRPGSREVLSFFLAQNGDAPRQPDRWMRYLYGGTELLDTTMPEARKELLK